VTCFVLGGSPCAGKSSIASSLTRSHGLELYACDAFENAHVGRSSLESQPTLFSARTLNLEQHFMRDAQELLEFELRFYREEWTLILEDLKDKTGPVLLEGAACLPELVPLEWPAVWLVPSPEFQRHHYAQRPWIHDVLSGAPDPVRAFDNWMARDELLAQQVLEQCRYLNRPARLVDGSQTIEQNLEWVRETLGLAPLELVNASGPSNPHSSRDLGEHL